MKKNHIIALIITILALALIAYVTYLIIPTDDWVKDPETGKWKKITDQPHWLIPTIQIEQVTPPGATDIEEIDSFNKEEINEEEVSITSARASLENFLTALNKADYESASEYIHTDGCDYNPKATDIGTEENPCNNYFLLTVFALKDTVPEMLQEYCTTIGGKCFKYEIIDSTIDSSTQSSFSVQFFNDDGQVLEHTTYKHETNTEFNFRVRKINNQYKVLELPPYTN